jgi:hypothetical protein
MCYKLQPEREMRNREESKGKKYLLGRTGENANGAAAG